MIFNRVEALPELFLIKWGRAIRDLATVRTWSWWSIGGFVAMLAMGLLFLFVRNMSIRRLAFGVGVVCLVACLATLTLGYLQKANIKRTDEAIVFAPSVTVRSAPDDNGNQLFILHEGLKVRIIDRIGEWCEVRIDDGNKGWMRIRYLEII